jgi:DNA-binding XRE family transcriptional regulator
MPLSEGALAQNVRRLAGMHLVNMEMLAGYIRVSRPTLQAIVAHDPHHRSLPRTETAMKLAEAFGVSLNALYSEPIECLREAVDHFQEAPIREMVDAPTTDLDPGITMFKQRHEIADAKRARSSSSKGRK